MRVKTKMFNKAADPLFFQSTTKSARRLKKRVRRQIKRAARKTTRQWIEGQG